MEARAGAPFVRGYIKRELERASGLMKIDDSTPGKFPRGNLSLALEVPRLLRLRLLDLVLASYSKAGEQQPIVKYESCHSSAVAAVAAPAAGDDGGNPDEARRRRRSSGTCAPFEVAGENNFQK